MSPLPDNVSVKGNSTSQTLQVVAVLRRCIECGERKPLAHFLLHNGKLKHVQEDVVVGDVKVCAGCRGRQKGPNGRHRPRRLGRYLDLPLDDWAVA